MWLSTSSPVERVTRRRKPALEKRAPVLLATERTTSRSPRSTSTSVIASLSDLRSEIASRCSWLWVRALSTRSDSSSRSEPTRTGRATAMSWWKASSLTVRFGRIGDRREPAGQPRQGFCLDPRRDLDHHVVENVDLLVGIALGAEDEKVGDPRQRVDALVARAGGKCVLQLVD